VLTDRLGLMPRTEARRFVAELRPFCIAPAGPDVTYRAWRIQDEHGFGWWDCLLLAAAALAGCGVFFSEDLQHGRDMDGLLIVSPFKSDFRAYLRA
jgi:predicted nucleic acid-binding protein